MMKGGVRILNLARGELVNDDDMLAALDSGKVACYVTDFPNNKILPGQECRGHPPSGRLHPRERGELRRHGRPASSRTTWKTATSPIR